MVRRPAFLALSFFCRRSCLIDHSLKANWRALSAIDSNSGSVEYSAMTFFSESAPGNHTHPLSDSETNAKFCYFGRIKMAGVALGVAPLTNLSPADFPLQGY